MADALDCLAGRMGIQPSYTDAVGTYRQTSRETQLALLGAMGFALDRPEDAVEPLRAFEAADAKRDLPHWVVCVPGDVPDLPLSDQVEWHLSLEDGSQKEGLGPQNLPGMPLGLHQLEIGGATTTVICAPSQLPLPKRSWGVSLPLYGLRPAEQGGLADYEDLARAGEAIAGYGAQFLALNPVHAGFLNDEQNYSPYAPSHRRRLNALHIPLDLPDRPGLPLIDYDIEVPRRVDAMRAAYTDFLNGGGDPGFEQFKTQEGAKLEIFTLHQALSDKLGPYWTDWPEPYRDPGSDTVRTAASDSRDAMEFHAWLQWSADKALARANMRLKAAGMRHGLYLDLAVGTHPAGAETWEDRMSFAFGASLGAPPDAFSADGQSWGLAPFNPHELAQQGFRALAETLRCQLDLAGMLRVDHILGFERAFWVPEDPGCDGAYVSMPFEAMLAVLRLEAARTGAVIIGEDLGNVSDGIRSQMAASGVLGCRVQMFERLSWETPRFRAPERYEHAAIASFSTHDLPTWRGWREGADLSALQSLGRIDGDKRAAETAIRAQETTAFDRMTAREAPAGTDPQEVDAMHHALAASQSALALVQIENVLDIQDQPNLPGTVTEYPNWRQRLPIGVDRYESDTKLVQTAKIMKDHNR
ncbi:MAG: 4-alpha-glucanotransferase [Pseudomonadota bacterium]